MNSLEGSDLPLAAWARELKAPLVLMRQLAIELESVGDEARRAEVIRRIRLTTERSLRLADNLTKLARLDEALFELEPVQVSGLINEVVDELSPLSRALHQTFSVQVGRQPVLAVGHRELLRALLMGLVDNALWQPRREQLVDITARVSRGETIVAVRDYGPIMDLNEYRRLSVSLGRRVLPISSRPLSSSLGLVIAHQFARAMNGRLSVSRHHSGGTTVRAHLPISAQLSLDEAL
jgi:signal transduction histidine kinase